MVSTPSRHRMVMSMSTNRLLTVASLAIIVTRAHARWTRDRARALAGADADDTSSHSSFSSLSSSASFSGPSDEGNATGGDAIGRTSSRLSLRQAMEGSDLAFNENVEQERRDTALAFRIHIAEIHDGLALSISEAVLLLSLAEWDVGDALASFASHEEARNRLRIAFDGMRHRTGNLNEESARLTVLIDITERADWLSIKLFLEKHKWRFVQAVVAWYKTGIRPFANEAVRAISKDRPHWALRVDHNGNVRPKPTEAQCRAEAEVEAEGWADETDDFKNVNDANPPAPIVRRELQGRNYNTERTRAPGFVIHGASNTTVKPGPSDPRKFLLEYVSKGQYRYNFFEHPRYFFSDRLEGTQDPVDETSFFRDAENGDDTVMDKKSSSSSSSVSSPLSGEGGKRVKVTKSTGKPSKRSKYTKPEVEFDFNTPSHLADLNAWRRQNRSRIEGATLRDAAQSWSTAELDFLYQLTQDWLADLKKKNPTKTRKDLLETSSIQTKTKSDWAAAISQRFTGTMQEGSNIPRRDRNPAAIMTMRGRFPRLFIHFRVNPDKKWLARVNEEELSRLEDERDAAEGVDLLLTANAILERRDQQTQVAQQTQQVDGGEKTGEDDEKARDSEGASDAADDGDVSDNMED